MAAVCAHWVAEHVTDEFVEVRHSRLGRSSTGRPGNTGLNAPGHGPVHFAVSPSPNAAGGRRRRVVSGHLGGQRGGFILRIVFVVLFIVRLLSVLTMLCGMAR